MLAVRLVVMVAVTVMGAVTVGRSMTVSMSMAMMATGVVAPMIVPATMVSAVTVAVEDPVARDSDKSQQPVKPDRDQKDGQRQHGRAGGKVPNFLHDMRISPDGTVFRDYKRVAGLFTRLEKVWCLCAPAIHGPRLHKPQNIKIR